MAKKMPRFWRDMRSIEQEIVYQVLFAELAFDICKLIPIIPGPGDDFLPYLYNLNMTKGVTALHSLLLSTRKDEITLKNYFDQYKWEYKTEADKGLREKIGKLAKEFEAVYEPSLRNNIAAHVSQGFKHTDFTSAYIMPHILPQLSGVTAELKNELFSNLNYSKSDYPFAKIKEQAEAAIKSVK